MVPPWLKRILLTKIRLSASNTLDFSQQRCDEIKWKHNAVALFFIWKEKHCFGC